MAKLHDDYSKLLPRHTLRKFTHAKSEEGESLSTVRWPLPLQDEMRLATRRFLQLMMCGAMQTARKNNRKKVGHEDVCHALKHTGRTYR